MTQTLLESELSVRGKIEQMERDARAWRDLALATPSPTARPLHGVRRTVGLGLIRIGRRLAEETAGATGGQRAVRPAGR